MSSSIRIQSISVAKTICWIQYTKMNRSRKNGDKDGKALCKLMNHVVFVKNNGNLEK